MFNNANRIEDRGLKIATGRTGAFAQSSKGFTLVEMIIVIVITGIIGGIVAVFMKAPIDGYVDSARRAELTDIADTAIRRMARDIRTAVPNSVRIAACSPTCIEFLPTKDGGRYRAELRSDGTGNVLNFGVADGIFDVIGSVPAMTDGVDFIVVGSTQSDGNPPYDVSGAGNLRSFTSIAGSTVTMDATALPASSELQSQRFDVVDGAQKAVTYACETNPSGGACTTDANGNGTCVLRRYWGYGFKTAQATPATIAAGAHTHSILADKVSDCSIQYGVPNQRFGLLAVHLTLTSGGESVSLYNEIHVNNVP
jgi:MSHA biogenesis protein MshO